jgi:hypothetical protein
MDKILLVQVLSFALSLIAIAMAVMIVVQGKRTKYQRSIAIIWLGLVTEVLLIKFAIDEV